MLALALPPVTTNSTTDWIVPLNSVAHCREDQPSGRVLPLVQDCTSAIRLLPRNRHIGTFRIGDDTSVFNLPQSKSYDSCKVMVILHEDVDVERGSWLDIRDAATLLSLMCRMTFEEEEGEQRTGGWITTGAEDGLVVELRRSRNVGVNGTGGPTGVGVQQSTNGVDVE